MNKNIIICLSLIFLLLSCTDRNQIATVQFGTSRFYPSFLWSKADTSCVIKKFDFEFSDDALVDNSHAMFRLVDLNGNPLNLNKEKFQFWVNDIPSNGEFTIKSDRQNNPLSVNLKFQYLPESVEGNHSSYLILVNNQHNLDRIDDITLESGLDTKILKFDIRSDHEMNPLSLLLLWILAFILGCLFLWFLILKRTFYPVFSSMCKQVVIQDKSMRKVVFTGYKTVVFANKLIKQSFFNKLLTGEILYVIDTEFVSPIIFKPRGKKGAFAFYSTGEYRISPNPVPKVGKAIIENNKTKQRITLN